MTKVNQNTNSFAQNAVLSELTKRGFNVQRYSRDFMVNGKRINVRGCNYDNEWAKKVNAIGGFDKINPENFDYLVCVSFDNDFEDVRCFVFSRHEVEKFPDAEWKDAAGLKKLVLKRNDIESSQIIKSGESRWDKIK